MPAVSAECGVDFMLPPQSDHQSECLFHSLFLGCVSRGLLGFPHEGIIDFDIGAHGPNSVPCVSMHDIIHIRGRGQQPEVPVATTYEIEHAIAKAHRIASERREKDMNYLLIKNKFPAQSMQRISRQVIEAATLPREASRRGGQIQEKYPAQWCSSSTRTVGAPVSDYAGLPTY
jgi:hypothetical protein